MKNYETVSEAIEGLKKGVIPEISTLVSMVFNLINLLFLLRLRLINSSSQKCTGLKEKQGRMMKLLCMQLNQGTDIRNTVNGYGITSDFVNEEMIKKLMIRHEVMDLFSIIK